jgi:hypothetical protein
MQNMAPTEFCLGARLPKEATCAVRAEDDDEVQGHVRSRARAGGWGGDQRKEQHPEEAERASKRERARQANGWRRRAENRGGGLGLQG